MTHEPTDAARRAYRQAKQQLRDVQGVDDGAVVKYKPGYGNIYAYEARHNLQSWISAYEHE